MEERIPIQQTLSQKRRDRVPAIVNRVDLVGKIDLPAVFDDAGVEVIILASWQIFSEQAEFIKYLSPERAERDRVNVARLIADAERGVAHAEAG